MLPELRIDGRLAEICLRDPARRNALDVAVLERLAALIGDIQRNPGIDVVVLEGEGGNFCSGFDLTLCAEDPLKAADLLAGLWTCVAALRALDMPVVACVRGAALAGGCALLTACDFVVVASDAQIGYPVHRIGISPAISAPTLMSRMGTSARALMMSGELLDGPTALARGLATHCVQLAALEAEVERLVATLLAKGPRAMRATKRWVRDLETRGSGEIGPARGCDAVAMAAVRDASIGLVSGDEFAEMLRSFWAARGKGR